MFNIIISMHNSKGTFHPHLHASNAHSAAVQPVYSIQYSHSLKQVVI